MKRDVNTVGEERGMEMGGEADKGVEALLLCVRDCMRGSTWAHRFLRDATH